MPTVISGRENSDDEKKVCVCWCLKEERVEEKQNKTDNEESITHVLFRRCGACIGYDAKLACIDVGATHWATHIF